MLLATWDCHSLTISAESWELCVRDGAATAELFSASAIWEEDLLELEGLNDGEGPYWGIVEPAAPGSVGVGGW